MAIEVEKLLVTLEANLTKYNRDLNQGLAVTNTKLAAMEARYAKWSANLKSSASSAGLGIQSVLGGIGAALGTAAIVEYANAWTRTTRAVDASEQAFGITLRSASELNSLANDARVDLEAYSKLYIRTSAAIRDYGYEAGTAEKVTSTLAKALKLGSASASEQTSVLLQFSQALQKGKLDGDEFRTVMENAGIVQELLADRLGVTKGEIIKMAQAGKLQIPDLIGAMVDGGARIDRIFRQMPTTIDEAFSVLRNNVIQFLGEADKATGASAALSNGIVKIGQNLGAVAVVAGAFLGSASIRMAAFAAATLTALNPLSLIAAAVGALAVSYGVFGDKISLSNDTIATLKDSAQAFADVLGGEVADAFKESIDWMEKHGVQVRDLADRFKDGGETIEDAARKLGNELNDLGGAMDGLVGKAAKLWLALNRAPLEFLTDGAVDRLKQGSSILDKVKEKADAIAMARGIESADLGAGLADYRSGKKNGPKDLPGSTTDPNAKRSQFQREIEQIGKRTAALKAEIATIGQSEYAQNQAKAAAELRFAAAESAAKAGRKVTADELAAIERLSTAYADAQVQVAFLNRLQSEKQGIDEARREQELVGLYGQELDAARRKLELLNDAKRLGITLTPEREQEIDETTKARAAVDDYQRKIEELKQSSADALKAFISDLREGKTATEALGNALENLADKLINTGLDQLVTSLIGGSAQPGGFLSNLLGGPTGKPFANGGYVSGPGSSRSDSIPARLSDGEFVVNADATSRNRQILEAINSGRIPKFADGGMVSLPSIPSIPNLKAQPPAQAVNLTIAPVFQVQNGTPEGVKTMQDVTLPQLQKVIRAEIGNLFDRDRRFARSGI